MRARIASACRLFFSSALIVFLLLNLWSVATPVQAERSNSLSGAGSVRPLFAPVPGVTLNAPANPFIGDPLTITVTFDNTGPDNGYGPYIDLFLPLSGADGLSGGGPNDGISFVSATYLGLPVTTNVLNCPAGSTVTHPLTGQTITCPAQPPGLYSPFTWQLVVITLPFGSFVPSQPPATVTVNANLSNYADLGVALPIQAQGGFMFGADPLNNPVTDPPIVGSSPVSTNVTPTLLTLSKSYNGPEDETATGPNFPTSLYRHRPDCSRSEHDRLQPDRCAAEQHAVCLAHQYHSRRGFLHVAFHLHPWGDALLQLQRFGQRHGDNDFRVLHPPARFH
jgi:hypothetical protein